MDTQAQAHPREHSGSSRNPARTLTLFLAGDVMLGRGIDQILLHPGNPALHEPYMKPEFCEFLFNLRSNGNQGPL